MPRRAAHHKRPLLDGPPHYDPAWRARHGHDDGSPCSNPENHEYWRYFDTIRSGTLTPEQEARYAVSRFAWMDKRTGFKTSAAESRRRYDGFLRQARSRQTDQRQQQDGV